MKDKFTIARHSLSQVRAMRDRGEDKTSPDAPEAESLGADFWKMPAWSCRRERPPYIFASTAMSSSGSEPMEKDTSPA
jgi:hypothetical protein